MGPTGRCVLSRGTPAPGRGPNAPRLTHQEVSIIFIHMKVAVQFTIDEELLRRIDRQPEVKKLGRSSFLRRAAEDYLRRARAARIKEEYQRAYERPPFPDELGPWPPETATWPDE